MNLANILENSARFFPDNTAIIGDDRIYTYSNFNNYACRIASFLEKISSLPKSSMQRW